MRRNIVIVFINTFLLSLILMSCSSNVLLKAVDKLKEEMDVSNKNSVTVFSCEQIPGTLDIHITWKNPVIDNFASVVLLKKQGGFADGYNDLKATIIYSGPLETFTDSTLIENQFYYYSIYTIDNNNLYSPVVKKSVELVPVKEIFSENVTDFTANQNVLNSSVHLTWTNSTALSFDSVTIVKSIHYFPINIDSPLSTIVYTGNAGLFIDTAVELNTIYYYTIFTKSTLGKYSSGKKANIELIQESDIYTHEVSGFTLSQAPGTTNTSLAWVNPADATFDTVVVLRKSDSYPSGPTDSTATPVYSGVLQTYTDTTTASNTIYYYAIYTKSTSNTYSLGKKSIIEIVPLSTIYTQEVSGFTLSQVPGTTNTSLIWVNPADTNFASVVVLRKTGSYPSGPTDSSATSVYTGTLQTYTDTATTLNTIYYYAMYTKNTVNNCSLGMNATIEIVSSPNVVSSYNEIVINFNSVAGDTAIDLLWKNPTNDFGGVLIKRKASSYPSGYNDVSATTLYEGNLTNYTDNTGLVNNTTYYYCIYAKNSSNVYSQFGSKTFKTYRNDFTPTVRMRSFYLIGGSSDYSDPFDNLVADIDAFDPVTNTIYANIATIPNRRYGCTIASSGGKIYIFGGLDSNKKLVSTVDVLNVSSSVWPSNVWETISDIPVPKYMARSENIDGKIYVLGGSSNFFGETTSPSTFLNYSTYHVSKQISMFDTTTGKWVVDQNILPLMASPQMNFISGVYEGNLFYGIGRYDINGSIPTGAGSFLLNPALFTSTAATAGTLTGALIAKVSSAGVMFHKVAADSSDIAFFISCGGTTTASTSEPIRYGTSNLVAIDTCRLIRFPISTSTASITWITVGDPTERKLQTARAYAEAEYYENTIYVFCGINNSGAVINSVEKIIVDDTVTFTASGFTSTGVGTLSKRFAFDITKINN